MPVIVSFVAFTVAFITTALAYDRFIVPLLPTVDSVPIWWWAICISPVIIVAIASGWWAGHVLRVILKSMVGAVAYLVALQFSGQGFHDIEAGSVEGVELAFMNAVLILIFLLPVVALGWGAHWWVRRRAN